MRPWTQVRGMAAALLMGPAVCGIAVFAADAAPAHQEPIELVFCNQAGISAAAQREVRGEVDTLFGVSGVAVHWRDCTVIDAGGATDTLFVVRLLARPIAPTGSDPEGALGRAIRVRGAPSLTAGVCHYVDVSYRAAASLAATDGVADPAMVLGAVIVHEIGHLLLGEGHTADSLMAGRWGRKQVDSIGKHWLRFTRTERRLIAAMLHEMHRQELLLARGRGGKETGVE